MDDYAFVIRGLLDLYEASLDARWLEWCQNLQAKQDQLFWDEEGGGYYSSQDKDASIVLRMKEGVLHVLELRFLLLLGFLLLLFVSFFLSSFVLVEGIYRSLSPMLSLCYHNACCFKKNIFLAFEGQPFFLNGDPASYQLLRVSALPVIKIESGHFQRRQ